jgi:hypothetical protein
VRPEVSSGEILEISVAPVPEPTVEVRPPPRSSIWLIPAVGAALLLALLLYPGGGGEAAGPSRQALPEPAPATTAGPVSPAGPREVEAAEIASEFLWIEVEGLDRFATVTAPVAAEKRFLTVGNPPGVSRSASVLVSDNRNEWNQIGTIHGVGGEVEILDLIWFGGRHLALGTYTEVMPLSDAEPRDPLPAVWWSDDRITWEMSPLPTGVGEIFTPSSLAGGEAVAMVAGWTDRGRWVEVYKDLPEPFRQAVGDGRLQLWHLESETVVVAGGLISVYRDPGPEAVDEVMPAQRMYRSGDGVDWLQVPLPPGLQCYCLAEAGPDGGVVVTDWTSVFSSDDGFAWRRIEGLHPGWMAAGEGRLVTFDQPVMEVWSEGGILQIRPGSLADDIAGLAVNDSSIALIQNQWPDGEPLDVEIQPKPVGDYLLAFDRGNVTVIDQAGQEVARWARGDLVPGRYDPEQEAVLVESAAGEEIVFPLDQLASPWAPVPAIPTGRLAVSYNGEVWHTQDLPAPGAAAIIGPVGNGYLVRAGENWDGSGDLTYYLAVP